MIYDSEFLYENLNLPMKILIFSMKISDFLYEKILMIFSQAMILFHEISYYKVRVSTGSVNTRWLGWQFHNG